MSASGRRLPGDPTAAANVLDGYQAFTATTAATTVIMVPAGRTFVGTAYISVSVETDAAGTTEGLAQGILTTSGAGVTPPAGTVFSVETRAAANAATGLTGTQGSNAGSMPVTVIAPLGNAVTLQFATTITGTNGRGSCGITGALQ